MSDETFSPFFSIPSFKIILLDKSPTLIKEWKKHIKDYNSNVRGFNTETGLSWFGVPVELTVFQGTFEELSKELETWKHFNPKETFPDAKINTTRGVTTVVSPGNSLGYLGGGIDKAIAELYTYQDSDSEGMQPWRTTERYLQSKLLKRYNGYLTPGNANLIEFEDPEFYKSSEAWTLLRANSILHIPSMRVPRPLLVKKYPDDAAHNMHDYYLDNDMRKWHGFIFDAVWEILSQINKANSKSLKWLDYRHCLIDTVIIPGIGTGYGGLPESLVAKCMIAAITIFTNSKLQPLEKSIYSLRFLNEDFEKLIQDDDLESIFKSGRRLSSANRLPVPGDGNYDSLRDSLDKLYRD